MKKEKVKLCLFKALLGSAIIVAFGEIAHASETQSLEKGDTAWLIVATALVMLMTLPGLALFYGGLSKRKDALNTMAMSFVAYAISSVLWFLYGYALAFGKDWLGIIGVPEKLLLNTVNMNSFFEAAASVPEYIFVTFQLTFAAITVALASGAFIERMKFSAWILFCVLWFTFSYVPLAHWVWGGGFLGQLGALDFAGGTVVHINAGVAALVGALFLGRRKEAVLIPHNVPMIVIGAGLLWFGWFGFNAGSALTSGPLASVAFLNTNTAAAAAALSWMWVEWKVTRKPTIVGLGSGVVAGLVAITPAAGFVNPFASLIIGAISGIICFWSVTRLKARFNYDDTLDAFGIHGVAGIFGAIMTGLFADPSINEAGKGLFYGNPKQLWVQLIAVVVSIVYVALITSLIFVVIKKTLGIRVSKSDEILGLDESLHGEKAYNFL